MRYSSFVSPSVLPLVALGCIVSSALAQTVTGPAIPIPPGLAASGKHSAARVFVVDDAGCRFTRHVQVAVDAAADGDVIVIRPGSYGSFVLDGKGVNVFAEAGPSGTDVRVEGFEVRNLAANQGVVVRGLYSPNHPIVVADNVGPVWIERCRVDRRLSTFATSDIVGLYGTALRASWPESPVARVTGDTTLISYGSTFTGFDGVDGYCSNPGGYCYPCYAYDAVSGGRAVHVAAPGRGFFFGSALLGGLGGLGGDGSCCGVWDCTTADGFDGFGLDLDPGAQGVLMDTALSSTGGGGSVSTLPGTIGGYSVTSAVESGVPATLTFTGPAGWNVLLTYSYRHAPELDATTDAWSVVPVDSPTLFVGAMPASGTLQIALPFHLPPARHAAVLYTQAKLYDTVAGNGFLAEPSALLVYRDPCP
jgi:hypothetical protein